MNRRNFIGGMTGLAAAATRSARGPDSNPKIQQARDAALAAYDHRAVLQARAVAATKRIAEEKIEKFAPLWKQRNIAMRLIEFIEKGRTNLTAAEKAEAVKLRGLWLRIKSLRAASNIIETDIAAMTKTGVTTFDPAASTKWPE